RYRRRQPCRAACEDPRMGAAALGGRRLHEPANRGACHGLRRKLAYRGVCLRPRRGCRDRPRPTEAHRPLCLYRLGPEAAGGPRAAEARHHRHILRRGTRLMFYEPEKRDRNLLPHDPFKAIVAPRPIGWITSMSAKGEVNLAPYSFFNGVNSRPNLVMFASESYKDSVAFIEETGEFVCS